MLIVRGDLHYSVVGRSRACEGATSGQFCSILGPSFSPFFSLINSPPPHYDSPTPPLNPVGSSTPASLNFSSTPSIAACSWERTTSRMPCATMAEAARAIWVFEEGERRETEVGRRGMRKRGVSAPCSAMEGRDGRSRGVTRKEDRERRRKHQTHLQTTGHRIHHLRPQFHNPLPLQLKLGQNTSKRTHLTLSQHKGRSHPPLLCSREDEPNLQTSGFDFGGGCPSGTDALDPRGPGDDGGGVGVEGEFGGEENFEVLDGDY
jgi:hypothetical protein